MQKNVSRPQLATRAMQRVVVLAEVRRHVRCRQKTSLETVRPVVIRALDAIGEMAGALLTEPRPAMAADVEQRVNSARGVARDDDALVAQRAREVVAGVRNLIGSAGADPVAEIEALDLCAVEVGVGVEGPREGGVHTESLVLRSWSLALVCRTQGPGPRTD